MSNSLKDMEYSWREILCPYCDKKYMEGFEDYEFEFSIKGFKDKRTRESMCPKCNNILYAIDGILEGIPKELLHEHDITVTRIAWREHFPYNTRLIHEEEFRKRPKDEQ